MKTPIPFLLALAVGGAMMTLGKKKSANPIEEDIPTSLDYEDPELHSALEDSEDSEDTEDFEDTEEVDDEY